MNSIWLSNLPIPPSVNASLVPIAVHKVHRASGRRFVGGRMIPAEAMKIFKRDIDIYGAQNAEALFRIGVALKDAVAAGWVLRVDSYVAFHVDRVFSSRNKKILRIDANNRAKAVLDAVVRLLGIDDSLFFRGDCEKVTTAQKDSECVMVRIQPVKARTLDQIKERMRAELATPS